MRRSSGATLTAFAVSLSIVGSACASSSQPTSSASGTGYKVAYLPCGQVNDKSWSQAGWEGVQEAKKTLGLQVALSESVAPADVEAAMRDYASKGYNLILAHCSIFAQAAQKVAKDYPHAYFTVNSQGIPRADVPNGIIYDPQTQQGSFVAGVLAGFTTKTNKLGAVGALNVPGFVEQVEGFRLGARFVNPHVQMSVNYINSFTDSAKSKQAALAEIQQGADIIFVATDQAAVGVFQAATESTNVLAIPQYLDQHALAPNVVLTSVLYNQGHTLTQIIQAAQKGQLGQYPTFTPGLKDQVGILAPFYGLDSKVSQKAKDCIKVATDDIISGQIVLGGLSQLGKAGVGATIDPQSLIAGVSNPCYNAAA